MPYRSIPLENEEFYHILNRGVEKRQIFTTDRDYQRFLQTLQYYQFSGPKARFSTRFLLGNNKFLNNPKIIEIISYCLMPNHFHLLLKQLMDNGTQEFISKISNSYTKYFNTKYNRVGPLFQGQFKAVLVETDEQLIHLSRYIHLNPYVSDITEEWENYPYSSYPEFAGKGNNLCNKTYVNDLFKDQADYFNFIQDHKDYAHDLERIKHLRLEDE